MDKVLSSPDEAVAPIAHSSSIAVGGFGLCGIPMALLEALHRSGASELRVVSNNCGIDEWGLGVLLKGRRISRMTSSYVGENKEFARQYLEGELEVELIPQGTLAERLRAGGHGIPAFYTPAGVGTMIADGGLPWRYSPDGTVAAASPPREVRVFGDRCHVLEEAIVCDYALVQARWGDTAGNLFFDKSARNFNPLCAMAGRTTIAEVDELVDEGALGPDEIHLPGIFVQHVVQANGVEKRIERLTVRR